MQIYIARDGEQTGPISMEQLVTMAGQGAVSPSDLAWHEGLADWVAVSDVLPAEAAPPVSSQPIAHTAKTRLGLAGFVIGVAGVALWFVVLLIAGNLPRDSRFMVMLGLGVCAMVLVNAVGVTLAVVALGDKDARNGRTIIGMSLNAIEILGFVLLLIIGLATK